MLRIMGKNFMLNFLLSKAMLNLQWQTIHSFICASRDGSREDCMDVKVCLSLCCSPYKSGLQIRVHT